MNTLANGLLPAEHTRMVVLEKWFLLCLRKPFIMSLKHFHCRRLDMSLGNAQLIVDVCMSSSFVVMIGSLLE